MNPQECVDIGEERVRCHAPIITGHILHYNPDPALWIHIAGTVPQC
jgi:hypothetical protein